MTTENKEFQFLVATVAQFATNDFVGRAGVASDAPNGSVVPAWRFRHGSGIGYCARQDTAQTFAGLQSFADGLAIPGRSSSDLPNCAGGYIGTTAAGRAMLAATDVTAQQSLISCLPILSPTPTSMPNFGGETASAFRCRDTNVGFVVGDGRGINWRGGLCSTDSYFGITQNASSGTFKPFIIGDGTGNIWFSINPITLTHFVTGKLRMSTSSATVAGFSLNSAGIAPSSPVDGDVFVTATDALKWRSGSNTRTVALKEIDNGFTALQTMNAGATVSGTMTVNSEVIKKRSFACIYRTAAGAAQSIPTGTGYTKITPFDTNLTGAQISTPDQANDKITAGRDGTYQVDFSRTYTVGTANVQWKVAVFVNGVLQQQTLQEVKSSSTATSVYACLAVQVQALAGQDIDVRVSHDNGSSVNLTYEHATLSITAID